MQATSHTSYAQPYHTPKVPIAAQFDWLNTLTIDITNGKVFNQKGVELGTLHKNGYIVIGYRHKQFKRANIIWWKAKGEWPTSLLDHDDRNRSNDRFDNLILSNVGQNNNNRNVQEYKRESRRDLPLGVYYRPMLSKSKPYRAQISIRNKLHYLGQHASIEEASKAVQGALQCE